LFEGSADAPLELPTRKPRKLATGKRPACKLTTVSSRIALALDVPSYEKARGLALAVRDAVGMLKVGLELFVEAGPRAVGIGREVDLPVFLDLKLHDIPATVERAVARASALGVKMVTVHAAGGASTLAHAVERAQKEGAGLEIVAVTVLTSLDAADMASLGVTEGLGMYVERLARIAWNEGVRAFVCSAHEAALLRAAFGSSVTLITPGVRAASEIVGDDQKRTVTAGQAIANGATWVVVGRPIRDAADPAAAARAIAAEIEAARGRG
jgi:orotidine-5'-phosphate decarboxylase